MTIRKRERYWPCAASTTSATAPSTRSLSILVYQEAFSFQRAGSGASLALIVTLLVTVLAVAYATLVRKTAGSAA